MFAYCTLLIIRAINIYYYNAALSGTSILERQLAKSYVFIILTNIIEMIRFPVILWGSIKINHKKKKSRKIALLLLCFEGFYTLTFSGRREIVFFFLVLILVSIVYHSRRFRLKHVIAGMVLFSLSIYIIFPAFLAFRGGYINMRSDEDYNTSELITMGFRNLQTNRESNIEMYYKNMSKRPVALINWVENLFYQQSMKDKMWGEAIFKQMISVVPRFIYPDKFGVHPESFVVMHYGVTNADPASSWLATGVADFGLLGAAIAGAFVALILLFGEAVSKKVTVKMPFIAVMIYGAFFNCALHTEISPNAYFSAIRNSILLLIIGLIYKKMIKIWR
jgi:hypothetical protein